MGEFVRTRLVAMLSPQIQLERMTNIQNWVTRQAVRVAVSLNIPDLIASGVTDVDGLAARVGADPDSLRRLSRHLVQCGVFTTPTPTTLGLTTVGELLLTDGTGDRHEYFQLAGVVPRLEAAMAGMMHSVRSGEPAYPFVHGEGLWEQMGKDPHLTASFDAEMARHARAIGSALADQYDWHVVSRIADVGGGTGALLRIVLNCHPHIAGTVIEFADAAKRARVATKDSDVAGRCEVIEADFLEAIPAVADAYLLSWILHDWDDEHALTILRHCRVAAGDHGRVLVVEKPFDLAPDTSLDLRMLVYFGGRERTRQEYETLATRSGLRTESWTRLVSGFCVMDCRPTA
jgi:hypothetical protein